MKRTTLALAGLLVALPALAAQGKHFSSATLKSRSGATVARAEPDASGRARFTNVPAGEYALVLTGADGRSVTVGDLDGDGRSDLAVRDSGGGAGKANVQDLGATAPAQQVDSRGTVVAPRDAASGMASGKRQHRPMVFLVDWSTGRVQGGFASPSAAQEAAQRLRESPSRACAVSIDADSQPGTIEVQSWSWGETQHGTYSSTR